VIELKRAGAVSIWLGAARPDVDAIDAFYDSRGIDAEVLGDGKDENYFNSGAEDIEDLVGLMPFSSSFADDVVAAARRAGLDTPGWICLLYDYAHDPSAAVQDLPGDPAFIGVFEYATDIDDSLSISAR
jgi:hypothetical protein